MLLTIDIGNTDIVSVLYNLNKEKIQSERISLVNAKVREEAGYFRDLIKAWNIEDVDVIISCVVPVLLEQVKLELSEYSKGKIIFLDKTIVSDFVGERKEVGADLIAVSYSYRNADRPTVILDMGSATKIILVRNGLLESVSIMLGVKNNMLALASNIKHLPEVPLAFPERLLGQNTVDAIRAGIMYSQYYGLKGYVAAIQEDLDQSSNKVLTGGIGAIFKDKLSDFDYIDELVNLGLLEIYLTELLHD